MLKTPEWLIQEVSISPTPETSYDQLHIEQFQLITKSLGNPRMPILKLLVFLSRQVWFQFTYHEQCSSETRATRFIHRQHWPQTLPTSLTGCHPCSWCKAAHTEQPLWFSGLGMLKINLCQAKNAWKGTRGLCFVAPNWLYKYMPIFLCYYSNIQCL